MGSEACRTWIDAALDRLNGGGTLATVIPDTIEALRRDGGDDAEQAVRCLLERTGAFEHLRIVPPDDVDLAPMVAELFSGSAGACEPSVSVHDGTAVVEGPEDFRAEARNQLLEAMPGSRVEPLSLTAWLCGDDRAALVARAPWQVRIRLAHVGMGIRVRVHGRWCLRIADPDGHTLFVADGDLRTRIGPGEAHRFAVPVSLPFEARTVALSASFDGRDMPWTTRVQVVP